MKYIIFLLFTLNVFGYNLGSCTQTLTPITNKDTITCSNYTNYKTFTSNNSDLSNVDNIVVSALNLSTETTNNLTLNKITSIGYLYINTNNNLNSVDLPDLKEITSLYSSNASAITITDNNNLTSLNLPNLKTLPALTALSPNFTTYIHLVRNSNLTDLNIGLDNFNLVLTDKLYAFIYSNSNPKLQTLNLNLSTITNNGTSHKNFLSSDASSIIIDYSKTIKHLNCPNLISLNTGINNKNIELYIESGNILSISFPLLESANSIYISSCYQLNTINFNSLKSINGVYRNVNGSQIYIGETNLISVAFPELTNIGITNVITFTFNLKNNSLLNNFEVPKISTLTINKPMSQLLKVVSTPNLNTISFGLTDITNNLSNNLLLFSQNCSGDCIIDSHYDTIENVFFPNLITLTSGINNYGIVVGSSQSSKLKIMSLPLLQKTKGINFYENSSLEQIDLSSLTTIEGSYDGSSNIQITSSKLTNLNLPELNSIQNIVLRMIRLQNNSLLTNLNISKLTQPITITSDIYNLIWSYGNTNLKIINFNISEIINNDNYSRYLIDKGSGNRGLISDELDNSFETVNMPNLMNTNNGVNKQILLKSTSTLKNLYLPKLKNIGGIDLNYSNLTNLDINDLNKIENSGNIDIRNTNNLEVLNLNNLNNTTGTITINNNTKLKKIYGNQDIENKFSGTKLYLNTNNLELNLFNYLISGKTINNINKVFVISSGNPTLDTSLITQYCTINGSNIDCSNSFTNYCSTNDNNSINNLKNILATFILNQPTYNVNLPVDYINFSCNVVPDTTNITNKGCVVDNTTKTIDCGTTFTNYCSTNDNNSVNDLQTTINNFLSGNNSYTLINPSSFTCPNNTNTNTTGQKNMNGFLILNPVNSQGQVIINEIKINQQQFKLNTIQNNNIKTILQNNYNQENNRSNLKTIIQQYIQQYKNLKN